MVLVSVVLDKGSAGITVKLPSEIREVVTSGWNNIGELVNDRKTVCCWGLG